MDGECVGVRDEWMRREWGRKEEWSVPVPGDPGQALGMWEDEGGYVWWLQERIPPPEPNAYGDEEAGEDVMWSECRIWLAMAGMVYALGKMDTMMIQTMLHASS